MKQYRLQDRYRRHPLALANGALGPWVSGIASDDVRNSAVQS